MADPSEESNGVSKVPESRGSYHGGSRVDAFGNPEHIYGSQNPYFTGQGAPASAGSGPTDGDKNLLSSQPSGEQIKRPKPQNFYYSYQDAKKGQRKNYLFIIIGILLTLTIILSPVGLMLIFVGCMGMRNTNEYLRSLIESGRAPAHAVKKYRKKQNRTTGQKILRMLLWLGAAFVVMLIALGLLFACLFVSYLADLRHPAASPAAHTMPYGMISASKMGKHSTEIVLNPAGTIAYVPDNWNCSISVIDTGTNNVTAKIPVGSEINDIVLSPDGTKAYVTEWADEKVAVLDLTTNTVESTINYASPGAFDPDTGCYAIALSPDGKKAYLTQPFTGKVIVADTRSFAGLAEIDVGSVPAGIALSPDGKKAYVANCLGHTVSVIDTGSNTVTATLQLAFVPDGPMRPRFIDYSPHGIAVSQDGREVYVTNPLDNWINVLDAGSNTRKTTIDVGSHPWGLAMSPDGKKMYVTNRYGIYANVIDLGTNTAYAWMSIASSYGVAVSPDSARVYVTDYDAMGNSNLSVFDASKFNLKP